MKRSWLMLFAFVLALGSGTAAAQIPPPVNIPITNRLQETPVWCWAAVVQQLVQQKTGALLPQCAIVAVGNGHPPGACCAFPHPSCVVTGSFNQIQQLIGYYGGSYSVMTPPANAMTLYNTLASGRPVVFEIGAGPGITHVVVVRGMRFVPMGGGNVFPILLVNDPMSHFPSEVPFDAIAPHWIKAMVVLS
jgi:hypothetical protein